MRQYCQYFEAHSGQSIDANEIKLKFSNQRSSLAAIGFLFFP